MEAPITKQLWFSIGLLVLALLLALANLIILALPLGIAGGFLLIKDMVNKYRQ